MKEIKIIGLTGPYCAGKNHVARILEQRLLPVLDVDKLGHSVIEAERERLLKRFGAGIIEKNGLVDRKQLGAMVFGRPEELTALEEIIHPGVNRETLEWINTRKGKACFINAALLHRSSAFEHLDAIILVEAPFLVRLLRAKMRDHLPWLSLIKRFRSQREYFSQEFYSQLLKRKTDIYRVSNSSGCTNSRSFFCGKCFLQNKLEKRIDEILSLTGITRV